MSHGEERTLQKIETTTAEVETVITASESDRIEIENEEECSDITKSAVVAQTESNGIKPKEKSTLKQQHIYPDLSKDIQKYKAEEQVSMPLSKKVRYIFLFLHKKTYVLGIY